MKRLISIVFVYFTFVAFPLFPSDSIGVIQGKVTENLSKQILSGVAIKILNTPFTAVSDERGEFRIPNIPVGNYNIKFYISEFRPIIKTDIIVRSKRITFVNAEINLTPIIKKEIKVSAGYFPNHKEQLSSSAHLTSEEIRRSPGSGGDISRILTNLPSIAKVSDKDNGLAVRGGSPLENAFFIDNIPIPHINHFPNWGSSGGAIGLLNVDFIQDVNFLCGGFSSIYGDRLSSILDIQFREGNREDLDLQIDLNMAGFGFIGEGPLLKGKGSWLFSARKSFLDLIVEAIGTGVAPRYSDFQGKIVFDLNKRSKLSLLGIVGFDKIKITREISLDIGDPSYGHLHSNEYTFGANWFWMWNEKGYSNTSISYSKIELEEAWHNTHSEKLAYTNDSYDESITLRNINYLSINYSNQMQFGFELKHLAANHSYFNNDYTDSMGNEIPPLTTDQRISANKIGIFTNYICRPFDKLQFNMGLRADYFTYNQNFTLSPRFSIAIQISSKTSFHGAVGVFNQNLPPLLLYQNENIKKLKNPMAYHYILGIDHLITDNTKMTIEIYDKEYFNFPMAIEQPSLFQCDEFVFHRAAPGNSTFVDSGRARAYGIEFTLQKKLANKIYGIISGSYFKTKYRDLNNVWRNRLFDNQFIFSIQGGFKPNNKWEFSVKWVFAGGTPYTPYDIKKSSLVNSGVFNNNKINKERYPTYHSLNIRFDKRFYFSGSNLTLFFSVWNTYNKKNIWFYYWNTLENKQDQVNQLSLIPVLGLEFEF